MEIIPQYLKITNSLLALTFIYYIFNSKKNIGENILAILIILIIITSQLFWHNPIHKSNIHIIDAYIAKITIISFIIYILFYKKLSYFHLFIFIILLIIMFYTFYLSDYYSNKNWCCQNHLLYHGIAHIFCFLLSIYAFI
jgi:hypothetical protein